MVVWFHVYRKTIELTKDILTDCDDDEDAPHTFYSKEYCHCIPNNIYV